MQKPIITLARIVHRGIDAVKICFDRNEEILQGLRKLPHLRWSATHKTWYIPYKTTLRAEIFNALQNKAYIDYSGLEKEIIDKRVGQEGESLQVKKTIAPLEKQLPVLLPEQEEKIKNFIKWLKSKRYSENTISTYTDALRTYLRFYANKPVSEITNDDMIVFNNEYILKRKLSASFQNQVVNAVKLFFRTIENKNLNVEIIHRPKNPKLLPNVLSKEEVQEILKNTRNLKHKTALSLIYACGLRRSELLNLKLMDVHYDRNLLTIRSAKGMKDRITPLSDKMIKVLRGYLSEFNPQMYIFEGWVTGKPYSEKSLQQVLKIVLSWLR